MRPLAKLILYIFMACSFVGCTDSELPLSASKRWQITDALVLDAEMSEDGIISALILADNHIEMWHNPSQRKIVEWYHDLLLPNSRLLHLSADGRYLLTANPNGLQLWDQQAQDPIGHLDLSHHLGDARITQLAFTAAPYQFVVGSSAGEIIFADTKNNTYRMNRGHTGEVIKLIVDSDKQFLFSAGNDGVVTKWSIQDFKILKQKSLPHRVTSLAVGQGQQVFASDALKTHIIWHSQSGSITGELRYWQQFQWFRQAIFVHDDRFLITSSPKTELFLWDLNDFSLKASWLAESQSLGSMISDLTMLKNGSLRSLSSDAVVQDWQLNALLE